MSKCKFKGCDKLIKARGYCDKHYQIERKSGRLKLKDSVNAGKDCSVEGCPKGAKAAGLCIAHYERKKKYGDPLGAAKPKTGGACTVKSCDSSLPVMAKGMCRNCYARNKRHGSPDGYSDWYNRRFETIIDENGYAHVYDPSHPNARKGGRVPEHRHVMADYLDRPLKPHENVHHINGNRADNRIENLELWITSQPSGQRPQDLLEYARAIISEYGG